MTVWTPSKTLRVKVLGLAWRGEQLLVSEVEDSLGCVKGVRPLGGSVDFGETREQALVREFNEELGCAVTVNGPWHAFENIYEHEGAIGHEFIFAANIALGDHSFYETNRFPYLESDETEAWATWVMPMALPPAIEFFPAGLRAGILAGTIRAAA